MAQTTIALATGSARAPRRCARSLRRVAGLVACAGALAACASYVPAPIDTRQSAEAFGAKRLDAPHVREDIERVTPGAIAAWPPPTWDRGTLLAVALAENGSLAVARAEVEAALAGEITAGESPNPTLDLQSEYARREPDHWLYGLSFDFLLRRRADLDIRLARLGTNAARAGLMEETWGVRRALTTALSDRESAERRETELSLLADAQDRLVATQRQRVEAGEDAPSALAIAESARLEIAQQRAAARTDAATADAAAAAALGVPPRALDGIAIAWPDWGDPPAVEPDRIEPLREQALLSRADLAAAIGAYAEAETKLERAIARQYPEMNLHPGYYWDHGIAKWPFDIGFALPLFHRNRGEIAEATAARDVAGKRLLALQAEIYGAIEAALRAEAIARGNLDAAGRRADAARRALDRADQALRLGASDRIEHAGAETAVRHAELDRIAAMAALQAARNALEDALHAPLSGPELGLALPAAAAVSGADE
ncbi:MAG TPA: TolC family protein [Rhodanobacteraceae bacterium]|nr:TolC family protein [Rhodanobacteraceae bacterium]